MIFSAFRPTPASTFQVTPEFHKRVLRFGLFLTPVLATFAITPLFLILNYFKSESDRLPEVTSELILGGIVTITITFMSIWIINAYLMKRFHGSHRPYLKYIYSFLILAILVLVTSNMGLINSSGEVPQIRLFPFIGGAVNNVVLWLILNLLYSREQIYKVQQEKTQFELSSIYAKHDSIKRQIQPHFLFNCLANLKNLIETKKNEQASEYTSSLSIFLRKSLELGQSDLVSLKDDWNFAQLYMEIQQLRFGNALKIQSNLDEAPMETLQVPVFALQLIIENVYKHNAISENNVMPLDIHYNADETSIHIRNPKRLKTQTATSGVGLKNLQERSLHLTGRQPVVSNGESHFEITLFCKAL